jgi:hypothetical protein
MLAFAMAMASCVTLFLIISSFVAEREVAVGVATLPFVSVSHVYEMLERHDARKPTDAKSATDIASFSGFGLHWLLVVGLGVLILVGIMNLMLMIAWLLCTISAASGATFPSARAMVPIGLPFGLAGGYLLGRWIGGRIRSHGILAVLTVVVLGTTLGKALDFLGLSPAELKEIYGPDGLAGSAGSIEDFLVQISFGVVLYFSVAAIGYWRGRRNRQVKYFRYLLNVLPADTRDTIVGMAYDEARVVTRRSQPARLSRQSQAA